MNIPSETGFFAVKNPQDSRKIIFTEHPGDIKKASRQCIIPASDLPPPTPERFFILKWKDSYGVKTKKGLTAVTVNP